MENRRSISGVLRALAVVATALSSSAVWAVDKIYSCDTCDAQKAEWVAAQHVPPRNCYFTNNGTTPTPEDETCDSVFSTFIVANPITEQAFKFRVNYPSCSGSLCYDGNPTIVELAIASDEASDLALFYQIDDDFRELMVAAPTVTEIMNNDIIVAMSANEQKSNADPNSGGDDCSFSPVRYFTSANFRKELEDIMADVLATAAGSQSFQDLTRDTDFTGFSVGRENISVSFQHNTNHLYHFVSFNGEPSENRLAFRVNYAGNVTDPGLDRIALQFDLVYPSSRIEGVNLEQLLQSPVSLLDMDDIGCLTLLFDDPDISETMSQGAPQWFPTDTGEGTGPDMGYFRCQTQTQTETCSRLENGNVQCITSTVTHWDVCEAQP